MPLFEASSSHEGYETVQSLGSHGVVRSIDFLFNRQLIYLTISGADHRGEVVSISSFFIIWDVKRRKAWLRRCRLVVFCVWFGRTSSELDRWQSTGWAAISLWLSAVSCQVFRIFFFRTLDLKYFNLRLFYKWRAVRWMSSTFIQKFVCLSNCPSFFGWGKLFIHLRQSTKLVLQTAASI